MFLLRVSHILVFAFSCLSALFKGMLELITFAQTLWLVDIARRWLEGIQEAKTLGTAIVIHRPWVFVLYP
jgi:hypothetical protein